MHDFDNTSTFGNNDDLRDSVDSLDNAYTYPKGLDLRPGHEFHSRLLAKLMSRAKASKEVMQRRYSSWRKIDQTLSGFINLDQEEKNIKREDERRPVSIVVPSSFATLDTLMAYVRATFLSNSPIFKYEGTGPEDSIGAMLLENIVEQQMLHSNSRLNLDIMFRDGFCYGFGVTTPIWETIHSFRREVVEESFVSSLFNRFGIRNPTGAKTRVRKSITYEGNRIDNINPYMYLPDPNVPIQDVQKGEFVGWLNRSNRFRILERESSNKENFFNALYIKFLGNATSKLTRDQFGTPQNANLSSSSSSSTELSPVDEMVMFINLIPEEWNLSSRTTPEKWFFMVAGDRIITAARPMPHDHNLFPVAVNSPDYDGYSVTPVSKMEVIYGMQGIVDWMMNSHIANVRKAINDMIIYDPQMINSIDMEKPGPGKLIRLRQAAWGRDVKGSIFQLNVSDITRANMNDMAQINEMMRAISGAGDSIQGIVNSKKERISAEETRQVSSGSLSRLESSSLITSIMAMNDMASMLASQTQQYMSRSQYIKMTGRNEADLRATFNDADRKLVGPLDISVDFDIIPHDGKVVDSEHVGTWMRLFEVIMNQEGGALSEKFDTVRIFEHIAQLTGVKNLRDFEVTVQPDEQVEQQVEAGNLQRIGGVNDNGFQ